MKMLFIAMRLARYALLDCGAMLSDVGKMTRWHSGVRRLMIASMSMALKAATMTSAVSRSLDGIVTR